MRVAFLFFLLFSCGKNKRVEGAHFFRAEEEHFFESFVEPQNSLRHNINTERERERERHTHSKEEEEEE